MLEGQTFPEVFPDYTVPENLKYILSNAVVSKVVMKQQKRQLVIHLKSEHIIQRKVLNKVAYDLKKELFGKTSVFISFDDTYELSAAYTLESITNDYWGSILHEVKNMGRVEYSLLANGEWGFEGNIMTILLEDSFLARDKSRVLKEYMEHLELIGEGGTDFRPAFEYVNHLIEQGEFYHLKGLIYFTDGKGTYPKKKPSYQTAFIFMQEEYEDVDVPPWAVKLIVDAEDLDEGEEEHEY